MKKIIGMLLLAVLGGVVALGLNRLFTSQHKQSFEQMQAAVFTKSDRISDTKAANFTEVAAVSTPAVVHIKTTISSPKGGGSMGGIPPEFRDFFGDRMFPPSGPQQATGSGVIITNDGYIATNNHVIEGASKIEVVLNDKRTYVAELLGADPETDLALLKIDQKELNFLPYGNSDALQIGEWVVAVGNPFNLTSTVTAGIVSAKGRNINLLRQSGGQYAIENFIQTDAAVNPGNSGGALVNTNGQLIGINTAIASQTGSFAGYSFAIPINLAKKILDDLLKYGEVKRAILGVQIQDIDQQLADEVGLSNLSGVYIPEVSEGGAAEKGGIKKGDVILSINGDKVNKSSELQEAISKYYPGDIVEIIVSRDGKEKYFKVKLLSKDKSDEISSSVKKDSKTILGATVENIDRDTRLKLKIKNGVRISSLKNGPLKSKGISEGFVITNIDKEPVESTMDVQRLLKNKKGGTLIEGVDERGNKEVYGIFIE